MAIDPRDPLESIDVKDTQPFRTEIKRVKRQLFHLGEDYEDPKVLFKYYRNMAARYGDAFVIARRQDGTLWSWGCSATAGQLGQDGITPTATPTQVSISGIDFSRVFAPGRAHTIALDVSGAPYTWGNNTWGQLGIDSSKGVFGAGGIQGTAIDEDGLMWTWGVNTHGNLGDGTWITARSSPVTLIDAGPWATITNFPTPAEEFCRKNPGHCRGTGKLGGNFLWAIKEDGVLYTCGRSNFGQLGTGSFLVSYSSPVSVLGSGARSYWQCCGGSQTMGCIDQNGEVWTWGLGSDGKLGIWGPVTGSPTSLNSPNNVQAAVFANDPFDFFANKFILNLSVGSNFMTALDTLGKGWGWGNNQTGQLGNDDDALQNAPQSVHQGGLIFSQTAAGVDTSMWLDIDGNVWMSGDNDFGRLAIVGDPQEVSVPTIVKGSPHIAIKVAAGTAGQNFGFLREDGSLWLWGENDTGQIGIGYDCPEVTSPPCDSGGTDKVTSPVSVIGSGQSYKFVDFWMGGNHTLAIDEDGQVWGWGSAPQIGNNSPTGEFPSPVQVSLPSAFGLNISNETTPTKVVYSDIFGDAAAAGWGHSLVIDQDDTLAWAWGGNWYGQLGVGDTDDRLTPTNIALGGGKKFRKIDAGDEHSITLDQRGQIFAWGRNASGQLGDGTTGDSTYPTIVEDIPEPSVSYTWRDAIISDNINVADGMIAGLAGIYPCQWSVGGFEFSDGIVPVPWTEPLVVSVEFIELNLSAGNKNVYATVSKGQNLHHSVPFMSGLQHTTATGSTDFDRDFVRVAFEDTSGGNFTNMVRVTRGTNTGSNLKIGVTVVEFNPNRVKVQKGRFDHSGSSITEPIDAVDRSKAFVYHTWRNEGTNNVWKNAMVRGRITSPTTVNFDRTNSGGDYDVRWWVVESLDDYGFIVETREWQHLASWSGIVIPPAIEKGNTDRMFSLISWTSNVDDGNAISNIHGYFEPVDYTFRSLAGANVTGRVCNIVGQAITFLDGTKSLQKVEGQYPNRKLNWTTNLTDWRTNFLDNEDFFGINGDFSVIIPNNPQGLSRQSSGFLDSMQVFMEFGTGDPPGYGGWNMNPNSWVEGARGNNAGTLGWTIFDVIEFDNLDEQSTGWRTRPNTPKPKPRTFGVLDGNTGYHFDTGDPLDDVWVKAYGQVFNSGNAPFSYKLVFKTPAAGVGGTSQIMFWYGQGGLSFNTREATWMHYARATRILTAGHTNDDHQIAVLEDETWYEVIVTYDGTTEKYFIDGEFVSQRFLGGPLLLGTPTTWAIMRHGWVATNIHFAGLLDEITVWKSDISEGELLLGGDPEDITGFIEVAAGSMSSYGIDTEGQAWGWGDNTYGQVGDDTTDNKSIPTSIAGRHSFIQVAAGGRIAEGHACALKPDGSVWCWGRNHAGQLGVCDEVDRSSPESVVGNHSFIDIYVSKGGFQTIAIKSDGSVWVWGKDPFCDDVDYCSPVSVPNFNLIVLNILGRGYFKNHSNLLRFS